MAGTAVVAMGCGSESRLVDVPAVADSVRALAEAGWNAVLVAPPAPPGGEIAGRLALALGQSRSGRRAVPVVTHTLVDPADPALTRPPAAAYPEPLAVLEAEAIAALVESGFPVVVAHQVPVVPNGSTRGFGGVPQSEYRPVAAPLEEAAFAQRLAGDLGAAALVFVAGDDGPLLADGAILPGGISGPMGHPGDTPGPPGVGEFDIVGAERHLAGDPRFASELRAAVRFLRAGGELAVIATTALLPAALDGPVPRALSNGVGTRLLRVRRTLARPRSEAPVLAAGWC